MEIESYSYDNRKEIDNIYIHDSHFDNVNIDLNNKKCIITLEREWIEEDYIENKTWTIIFENLIHFECDRLALFGECGNEIMEMYLNEDEEINKYINHKVEIEQKKICGETVEFKQKEKKFISIGILTNTGDTTSIICEKIIIISNTQKSI